MDQKNTANFIYSKKHELDWVLKKNNALKWPEKNLQTFKSIIEAFKCFIWKIKSFKEKRVVLKLL